MIFDLSALSLHLSRSEVPPIIIIQSDEGPYPDKQQANPNGFNWATATNDEWKEKMGILNALYLPDVDKSLLHPSMTSVNIFRIVFNTYFKTRLKLLPDKKWVSLKRGRGESLVELLPKR